MIIENVSVDDLKIAPFKSTYLLRPDLLSLSSSLFDNGILSPLIVQKSTNIVIDGNERLNLVKNQNQINAKLNGIVPVNFVDCDSVDARLLHIGLNRARSSVVAKPMSSIIRSIILSKKYTAKDLDRMLSIKKDEFDLMMDGTLLKHRKVSEHKYSRAWVPVEAPAGTLDRGIEIESPPNADR
jgi:hypothetical protein